MFDLIIREAASRFGLGDKAGPLVQMLLADLTNKSSGGLPGFISKLTSGGLGNVAQSWLGGGAGALPVSSAQIESLMGGQGGLISNMTSKLGIGGSTATSVLSFLLPMVIGKLTPGGTVPTSLSRDVMGFISGGTSAATVATSKVVSTAGTAAPAATQAAADTAVAQGGSLMKWLPWFAAGIAALFVLSYCNKGGDIAKQNSDNAKANAAAAASAPTAPAAPAAPVEAKVASVTMSPADAAKAAAEAIPAGADLVSYKAGGMPALKVYFDTGKTDVAEEFGDKSKDISAFLTANAGSKAIVSGYNDPTGDAAANAELSKNRAKNVAAALKAAGIAEDRVMLEKPSDITSGAALSNAEARRVEVTIRK